MDLDLGDIEVIRLHNADALDTLAMRDLFARAFERPAYVTVDAAIAEVRESIKRQDPEFGIFVAIADRGYVGLMVMTAYTSAFAPLPWVVHFYAEKGAKEAMSREVLDWMLMQGYDTFNAVNRTGIPDSQWMKFWSEHVTYERLGSLMQLTRK